MRRRKAEQREILPDPKYHNKVLAKFINMIMERGKKSLAQQIIYDALEQLKTKIGEQDAMKIFNRAIENVRPQVEVKSRRVGGATYQVPVDIKMDRSISLALRWIRDYARGRKGKTMTQRLTEEILDAYNKTGNALKKKEDTHKMAEANKAFAHLKW